MAKKYDKQPHLQSDLWRTESEWWAWLRGKSRQIWSDYPIRNNFKRTKLVPNFEGSKVTSSRVKSVGQCQICSEWFAGSNLQVDHITQAGSIGNSWEGYFNWFYDLLAEEDNMQLVCKPCHLVKTHADRLGVSFEEARIKKEIIRFSKMDEDSQRAMLIIANVEPTSSRAGRVRQYEGLLNLE